ncbi:MAG: cupin [Candidatus Omnitrophica bacterium]|nr:cupin [Candidatus Omnitrophota bacterium]
MSISVIEKPWGREELVECNDRYVVKRLTMNRGHRCSLQYHQKKKETIYVLSGYLNILTGSEASNLLGQVYSPHQSLTIEPGVLHRMEAIEDCVYLESSTPELEDVVRILDDYSRN